MCLILLFYWDNVSIVYVCVSMCLVCVQETVHHVNVALQHVETDCVQLESEQLNSCQQLESHICSVQAMQPTLLNSLLILNRLNDCIFIVGQINVFLLCYIYDFVAGFLWQWHPVITPLQKKSIEALILFCFLPVH